MTIFSCRGFALALIFRLGRRTEVFFGRLAADFFRRAIVLLHCGALRTVRKQGARRSCDIGLPHQAFANQERRNADAFEARKVGRRIEPAFGNDDALAGDFRRQKLTDRERRLKRPQIAVIDADKLRFQLESAHKFNFIMNFNKGS